MINKLKRSDHLHWDHQVFGRFVFGRPLVLYGINRRFESKFGINLRMQISNQVLKALLHPSPPLWKEKVLLRLLG